jgi:hypothetical protein
MKTKELEISPYTDLEYTHGELKKVMREHYDKIIAFVTSEPFQELMVSIAELPSAERAKFVHEVLLDDNALKAKGVEIPDGILIQRSAFGDRRPTLFAVKHFLPDKYTGIWQNVNITFDNKYVDNYISRDREVCWRAPLSPDIQANAMANDMELESI